MAILLHPGVLGFGIFAILWLVFRIDPSVAGLAAVGLTIAIWWWIERHPFGPKFYPDKQDD